MIRALAQRHRAQRRRVELGTEAEILRLRENVRGMPPRFPVSLQPKLHHRLQVGTLCVLYGHGHVTLISWVSESQVKLASCLIASRFSESK